MKFTLLALLMWTHVAIGSTTTENHTLAITPLGQNDKEALEVVRRSIESKFGWKTIVLPARSHPQKAWYAPRKRYRAEKILGWIRTKKPSFAEKIMALTTSDISTTKGRHKDWGICGLADLDGEASVVSSFRIKRKLSRFPRGKRKEIYLKRLNELAAHEFGHQLGLDHCRSKGCLMEDAKGTVDTFNHSTGTLCADCRHRLSL